MKKLFNYFKRELQLEGPECMNEQQKVALKNLIEASRERVWLAEPLHVGLRDISRFDRELSTDIQQKILDSAGILEKYLNEQNKPRE